MASFLKKALGVFVEIEETPKENQTTVLNTVQTTIPNNINNVDKVAAVSKLTQTDLEKFENHFDKLFDQSNMQGPDYYEFCKMLETLEAHIPDEKTRFSAVFASLSIQGLTKQKLIDSANYYREVVLTDKARFEKALDQKSTTELESKKSSVVALEKKMVENSELIKKLTQEISEAQAKIGEMKNQIKEEEEKLSSNKSGYNIACDAMLNKINLDSQKIQNNL